MYYFRSNIFLFVRNEYKRYKGRPAALLNAIAKARKLNLKTGKHYKVYFIQNRYQCLNRLDIKWQKRTGVFNEHINATRMTPLAFFDTQVGFVTPFAYELLRAKYSGIRLSKHGIVQSKNT